MTREDIENNVGYWQEKANLEYIRQRQEHGVNDPYMITEINEAFDAGYDEGYQYALQHPQWIPVEKRLPKFDEQVLVYGLYPNGCRLFYVDCLIQDINDNGYPKWDDDTIIPTHWMPIVPPRKEDNNV